MKMSLFIPVIVIVIVFNIFKEGQFRSSETIMGPNSQWSMQSTKSEKDSLTQLHFASVAASGVFLRLFYIA